MIGFIVVFISCVFVFSLATLIQRISGFGMGIIAILILPYLLRSHIEAALLSNLIACCTTTILAYQKREYIRWELLKPLLIGSCTMTIFSVWVAKIASFVVLEKVLAIMLIGLAIYLLFLNGKLHIKPTNKNGLLAGGCGGILNGLFSAGGTPVAIFILGATTCYPVYFATLQAYFSFNTFFASFVRIMNGMITARIVVGIIGGGIGVIGGNVLSKKIEGKISEKYSQIIIYIIIGISGIVMLF